MSDGTSPHFRKAALGRVGLVAGGLLVACLVAEGMLRVTGGIPEVANPLYSFHESDPVLGWRGKRGVRLRFHRPDFDALVEHGPDGFRRPEPAPLAAPAARVLFLGDSFTWGWGVGQGEVFTDELQRRLPAVGIYNRGVNAFGTSQEYLLLQRELEAGRYDAVVVMFFQNDVQDNLDGKHGRRPYFTLADGQLVAVNQPPRPLMSPFKRFFKDHSRAYQFVDFQVALFDRWLEGTDHGERDYGDAAFDFHDLPGYAVTARLLGEMRDLASAHGAKFFLVYLPHHSELVRIPSPHPYVRAVHAMIDDVTAREGIPLIDLAGPFYDLAQRGTALLFPHDEHWTADGHRLVADVLLPSPIFATTHSAGVQ